MKKPDIEAVGYNYRLTWLEGIQASVSRVKERGGAIIGTVEITTTLPALNGFIHQAQLNLESTRTRTEFAKQCEKRTNSLAEIDWDEVLQQLCVLVLNQYRIGEPSVILTGDLPRDRLDWRVNPFIAESQANVLYGAGGSAKTLVGLYLACLVDIPMNQNGLEAEPGNVLFLDYETDHYEIDHRIGMIKRGLGIPTATDIIYRFCSQALADDIEAIQDIVMDNDIALIIVDSLGAACGDEPEKAAPITGYFMALRSLKKTSLTIHHTNKEGELYGNSYIFNQGRNIWEIKKSQEENEDQFHVGLFHRKVNNGKLMKPLGFKLIFQDNALNFMREDVSKEPSLVKYTSLKDQVWELLLNVSLEANQIAEELERTPDVIRRTLNRYPQLFTHVTNGWARVSKELP